jgi:hypothetical protein
VPFTESLVPSADEDQLTQAILAWASMREHALAQCFDHVITVQPAGHPQGQALPGELVDHGQQPQAAAILGACFYKLVAPHEIALLRSEPDAGSVVEPQAAARLLLGRNFQSFPPPDALHPISPHVPTGLSVLDGDAAPLGT